jgi:hypothetical protein
VYNKLREIIFEIRDKINSANSNVCKANNNVYSMYNDNVCTMVKRLYKEQK